jgi:protein-S-isoprenylcysteine O-methyltransferase Ste14
MGEPRRDTAAAMYSHHARSIPQKSLIIVLESLILWASYVILFQGGFAWLLSLFGRAAAPGNVTRHVIIFILNCVVYVRMWITIAYLVKRRIPLQEAISIPFAFALYYLGFACLGYQSDMPMSWIDGAGIVLFVVGSVVNTGSELLRDAWKKNPDHKGKLYTGGLFRYEMHINYYGDFLWVCGYALVTRNIYAVIIPIMLFCLFVFYNIPLLDSHLEEKYREAFIDYRRRTKRFIPWVY